ncbi:DoxX family membrane protein [Telluria aromaticivorans]|uniref:DoxX family protein n=1 Tax=Telluria aromaticivorans TaxID=2725995 RepID=A0A7Y2JXN1_9BURK|nr:hypothetical protein [Telluria aromaticivorans]NNG22806.1 hypothetical protein [Telluria aromaticivorans]
MNTQLKFITSVLLLRLMIGALLMSHAFLGLVALGVPAFGAALEAQGMPIQGLPVGLAELVTSVLVLLGSYRRTAASPLDRRVGGSPARAFKPR